MRRACRGGIYVAIKQKFKEIDEIQEVEHKISEMKLFASYYASLLNPDLEKNAEIRAALKKISALEVTVSYPLIMQLLSSHRNNQLNTVGLCECISIIEAFVVRRSVCGVPTNALNKLFLQWCKAFPKSEHKKWLHSIMSSGNGGRRFPSDDEFGEAFKSQMQYGRGSTRYILIRLERDFSHKEPVDLSGATIEHIMPQTLSDAWKEVLGSEAGAVHEKYCDTFGNLSLTGYNSELGNLSFDLKKQKLDNTHIDLNKWILEQNTWNKENIIKRAELLFDRAVKIWIGPLASN